MSLDMFSFVDIRLALLLLGGALLVSAQGEDDRKSKQLHSLLLWWLGSPRVSSESPRSLLKISSELTFSFSSFFFFFNIPHARLVRFHAARTRVSPSSPSTHAPLPPSPGLLCEEARRGGRGRREEGMGERRRGGEEVRR